MRLTTLQSQREPKFQSSGQHLRYIASCTIITSCFANLPYIVILRLSFTRNTRLTVTCGAMVWCCLRSGQLGRSHSHNTRIIKCLDWSKLVTASPLPLDALEPSTNSWSTAGAYIATQIYCFNSHTCMRQRLNLT